MAVIRSTAKSALRSWHRAIAKSPIATKAYLSSLSVLCRNFLPQSLATKLSSPLQNFMFDWPRLDFAPRKVVLGDRTRVKLLPHTGEFDQQALFIRQMPYERAVFRWLEREAPKRYDRVIEIGANVGIYSIFFNALCGLRLKDVIAFEPSLEAFRRLLANLAANKAQHVMPYLAAVAETAGFFEFHEPTGHLTNGSFLRDFACVFSDQVKATTVAAVGPTEIEHFFKGKVLLKIDVEGFEPQLLAALGDLIIRHKPDLLIEILPGTPEGLDGQGWLENYDLHLILDSGLQKRDKLSADVDYRDWMLMPKLD